MCSSDVILGVVYTSSLTYIVFHKCATSKVMSGFVRLMLMKVMGNVYPLGAGKKCTVVYI